MSQKRWIDNRIVTKIRVGANGIGTIRSLGIKTVRGGGAIGSPIRIGRIAALETGSASPRGRMTEIRCSKWR